MSVDFPTDLFGFLSSEIDLERQTIDGGVALSGAQDHVSADGGGRVFAEFDEGAAIDRAKVLRWRALLTQIEPGVTRTVVPFCDPRYTPYGSPAPTATAAANMALRATSGTITATLPQPLLGGEWFSIQHPTKGWRAYRVATVGSGGAVTFRPPLREAVPSGATIEFAAPRCLMVRDGKASSRRSGRYTPTAIRFVEAP